MIRRLSASLVCLLLFACGPDGSGGPGGEGNPGGPDAGKPIPAEPIPKPEPREDPMAAPVKYELPPVQTTFETYELTIPQAALDLFAADIYAPEQPATFTYEGQSYPVNVRLRGASARSFPKKSWNVDFEDLRFQGREELNLVAEYQDSTMMVEKLAYDMLKAMNLPAPYTRYVRVVVNGEYQGLYLDIEEVDKKFVQARPLPDSDPSIYRCGYWDCEMKLWHGSWQGDFEKQTHELEPRDDLAALLELINFAPEPLFAQELEKTFELDWFLRLMAFEVVISNNFLEDAESYYVHDRVSGRWYYVPWDLNNADPRFWPTYGMPMTPIYEHPLFPFTLNNPWLQRMYDRRSQQQEGYEPTFCNLRTRIVNNPELLARLLPWVEKLQAELLDPAKLIPWIEQTWAAIAPHMADDPYVDPVQFAYGREFLTGFVGLRNDFIREELERWKAKKPGLVIERFDPAGGWIELENRSDAPVSTSGLVLTTYLRRAVVPSNVPARTLQPGESVRFTASELGVTFDPKGQIGLFDGQTVSGLIDVLYYGGLAPGQLYARGNDAEGRWQVQ